MSSFFFTEGPHWWQHILKLIKKNVCTWKSRKEHISKTALHPEPSLQNDSQANPTVLISSSSLLDQASHKVPTDTGAFKGETSRVFHSEDGRGTWDALAILIHIASAM